MCLNCGCDEYEKRHKPSDITMEDLRSAAKGQNMDIQKAATNLQEAGREIGQHGEKPA